MDTDQATTTDEQQIITKNGITYEVQVSSSDARYWFSLRISVPMSDQWTSPPVPLNAISMKDALEEARIKAVNLAKVLR